jgi:NAD(P)-dependent dehydrogenase (short-subunit alcohol dehydrogenase family)
MLGATALGLAVADRLRRSGGGAFEGAVVLITGGSRGLGLLLAREFGRQGARLAICARDQEELTRAHDDLVKRGYEVFAVRADVSHREAARDFVDRTVAHYGRLDVAVSNAGTIQVGPVEAMDTKDFHDAMATIFWGTYHIATAAMPHLKHSRRPRLVNIASIGGAVAVPHLLPYSTAKFAAVGFSSGLAVEMAKEGIPVVTILPGLMRTGSFINALVKGRREEETAWFSVAASLPFLSMSGTTAARRIVAAARAGSPFVTLGLPAKVLRLSNAIFPGTMIRFMTMATRFLPSPLTIADGPASRASEHRNGVANSLWVALGDRAAAENNEEHIPARESLH